MRNSKFPDSLYGLLLFMSCSCAQPQQISSSFNLADKDAQKGKKSARKSTRAGGSGIDLQKVAQEQQAKLEKEREERKEQIKVAKEAAAAAPPPETPAATASGKAAVAQPKAQAPETGKNTDHKGHETIRYQM